MEQSTILEFPRAATRRSHRFDRLQVTVVLALLALAVFSSIQLNHLAVALTR